MFSDCSFAGTRFRAADLTRSTFTNCQFNDNASERPADFGQANLREAIFERCNLTVVEFIRCNGYGLTFSDCQMQGVDLSKSDFRLPIGDSDLAAFTMQKCNFSFGSLAENYLAGAEITGCRLLDACLDYCDLTGANLAESELHNLIASGVTLRDADLRGATFNNLNPRDIDLEGIKLYYDQLAMLVEPLGIELENQTDIG